MKNQPTQVFADRSIRPVLWQFIGIIVLNVVLLAFESFVFEDPKTTRQSGMKQSGTNFNREKTPLQRVMLLLKTKTAKH